MSPLSLIASAFAVSEVTSSKPVKPFVSDVSGLCVLEEHALKSSCQSSVQAPFQAELLGQPHTQDSDVFYVPDAVPVCLWHNKFCLSVLIVSGFHPASMFPQLPRVHSGHPKGSAYSFTRNVWSVLSSRSWSQDVQEFFQRWLAPALQLVQPSHTVASAKVPASDTQEAELSKTMLTPQEAEFALEQLFQRKTPLETTQVKPLLEALDKTCQPYTQKGTILPPGLVLLLSELLEKAPHILLIQRAVHWANRLKLQATVTGLCLLFEPTHLATQVVFTSSWGCGPSQLFQTQRMALQTLGILKNNKALPTLLEVVQNLSLDYRLRLAAADALGRLGHHEAAPVLQHVASNPDENSIYVKESSIKALGLLGDLHAMTEIAGHLFAYQPSAERLIFLKETLLQSIAQGHIHELPESMRVELQQVLETVLQDASATLRAAATFSISELKLHDFVPVLKKRLLEETPDVAVAMVHALAMFEEHDWLQACLTTHEESLPKKVVQAFRQVLQQDDAS
jgi:HEAT repeat protein